MGENGDAPVNSPRASTPVLEVQEFPPLEAYSTTSHYYPHLSFTHHLYVYPTALKYDNQKAFAKVRGQSRELLSLEDTHVANNSISLMKMAESIVYLKSKLNIPKSL